MTLSDSENVLLPFPPRDLTVSVVPPWRGLENNALFESRRTDHSSHSPNIHWLDCFAAAYKRGKDLNIHFGTDDVISRNDADVVIYMAQPNCPRDIVTQKLQHPSQKIIFLMWETSLGARYTANPKNHRGYDAVFTYVDRLIDGKRYFFFPPRAFFRDRIVVGVPFENRRFGCLVGTNRKFCYRSGLVAMMKGWRFSAKDWTDYVFCPGELIRFRSQFGTCCINYDGVDLFGEGWGDIPGINRIYQGVPSVSTLSYLGKYRYYFAFENHTSDSGLISERVWDALWGDSVPVYRGNTGLHRFIPRECYIDATPYNNPKELLDWLCSISRETWLKYREAGREYIQSSAVDKFLPDVVAHEFISRIAAIAMGSPGIPNWTTESASANHQTSFEPRSTKQAFGQENHARH